MNTYFYCIQLHMMSELGHLTQANELIPTDAGSPQQFVSPCLTFREASLHKACSLGTRVAVYNSVLSTMNH